MTSLVSGIEGAKCIGDCLVENSTLQEIDLGYNSIVAEGCIGVANGLTQNKTLLSLNISGNFIGAEGGELSFYYLFLHFIFIISAPSLVLLSSGVLPLWFQQSRLLFDRRGGHRDGISKQ